LDTKKWVISAVILVLIAILWPFVVITPGQCGVRVTLGKMSDSALTEGLHMRVPLIQNIRKTSLKIQKDTIDAEAATKDLQSIKTKMVINWSIPRQNAANILRNIGNERDVLERIIIPAANETVKAATAKRSALNILVERATLKTEVDSLLAKRLLVLGIRLNDLSFVNFDFSKEFNDAIEAKQIAEQKAQQAVYEAQQAEQQANAQINRAKGEAEAKRLLSQTVTPKILALEFFQKWDGHMPSVVGSDSSLMVMMDQALKQASQ
jgi:regulator of protease activity HflC (stomatin/prohibitin superfamily)